MPEDIPKTVMMLIWLLSGTIIFGWLLMQYPTLISFAFAAVFFGLPVIIYKKMGFGSQDGN
ncbi:MAG: FUSC family protein [Gammaproteobacteria bacterium]|nr:FUSC family protein [Gammaproteobacteria bacterium]MDH5777643.1 FUSC family protein [Gammaproteobacteria bacterium]